MVLLTLLSCWELMEDISSAIWRRPIMRESKTRYHSTYILEDPSPRIRKQCQRNSYKEEKRATTILTEQHFFPERLLCCDFSWTINKLAQFSNWEETQLMSWSQISRTAFELVQNPSLDVPCGICQNSTFQLKGFHEIILSFKNDLLSVRLKYNGNQKCRWHAWHRMTLFLFFFLSCYLRNLC